MEKANPNGSRTNRPTDNLQLRTRERGSQHETSFDQCGGGRRARVLGAGLGATSQSVRRQRDGRAGSEPRRTGTDALQLGPKPGRIGAVWSAHRAACGNGSLGDAAVLDVGYQFGNAAEAPGIPPCFARQTRASSQPFPEPAGECRKSVEWGRTCPAPIRRLLTSSASSRAWHGASPAGGCDGCRTNARRRKGHVEWIGSSLAFIGPIGVVWGSPALGTGRFEPLSVDAATTPPASAPHLLSTGSGRGDRL